MTVDIFGPLLVIVLAGLAGPLLSVSRRSPFPAVVGELVAGVVLGRSGFGVIDPSKPTSAMLYGLGFVMVMLVAGSHLDLRSPGMRSGVRSATAAFAVVALLSVPAGVVLGQALAPATSVGLFVVLLAGSSAAVAIPVLEERGLLGPEVGPLIAWIALADTVTVLLMPMTITGPEHIPGALLGDGLILAATIAGLALAGRIERSQTALGLRDQSRARGWALQLRAALVMLVSFSLVAIVTGGSTLLAGFGVGVILARLREPQRLELQISGLAEGFFVPAFFVLLGAELDVRGLLGDPRAVGLAVAMAVVVVATHLAAARVTRLAPWTGFGLAASAQLGLPAAAASLGLSTGTVHPSTAAALVVAGCLTMIPASLGTRQLAEALGGGKPASGPEENPGPAAPATGSST